ncbi:hypothetical protein GU926_17085 [Nibribacter ruber]|uniref:Uncharacterized protein n=1 Tax=Nibribacter ruber TaxID=2698458 RepID=A0A6P1P3Z4_9BACT|nr:hypothetical protein [Nibribacter ruber]QHL89048.1 hypothetical protein GU926_17085 [Nibribacter ruber]
MAEIDKFFELINKIERKYPVQEWTINGIDAWPFVRVQIRDIALKVNVKGKCVKNAHVKSKSELIFEKLKVFIASIRAIFTVFNPFKRIKVFLLGYVAHRQNINNVWNNRFYEFLLQNLHGRTAVLLELKKTDYVKPRYNEQFVCEFSELAFLYRSIARMFASKTPKSILPQFREVIEDISETYPEINRITVPFIENYFNEIRNLKGLFSAILKFNKPEAVLLLSYYSFEATALVLAANVLGIPSVDMQHGVQGDYHIGYGNFFLKEKKNYNTLPAVFWNWDMGSAKAIKKWSKGSKHKPFVGGNTWLEFWGNSKEFNALYKNEISQEKKNVLISLQPSFDYNSEALLNLIASATINGTWFIRVHPRQLAFFQEIQTYFTGLARTGGKQIEVSKATTLPLPVLLETSLVHITFHSSVAIEAASFNIPTVFLLDEAKDMYKGLIPAELLFTIESLSKNEQVARFEQVYYSQAKGVNNNNNNNNVIQKSKTIDDFLEFWNTKN